MKRTTFANKVPGILSLLAVTALAISSAHGATRTWTGATSTDYNTTSNWTGNDIPDGNDSGILAGGGTGITDLTGGVTPSTANALNVRGGHVFNINNAGGTLNTNVNVNMGRGATGNGSTINHSAGAFNIGGLDMGGNPTGGTSIYNLSGTASLSIDHGGSARDFDIGGNAGNGDFATTFSTVGDSATITLNATAITLRSSAHLSFVLGATGIDAIDTTGNFTLQAGAELTVDGSSYTGGAGTIPLFTYGSRADATEFTTENISGFGSLVADVVHDGDSVDLVLTDPTAPMIDSFTADTTQVGRGDPVTLTWAVTNETSLIVNPGDINVFGTTSLVVNPETDTTYALSASNGVDFVEATVDVMVGPILDSFDSDVTKVLANGEVNLSWSTQFATTLTLDPGGIDVSGLTTIMVNPTETTTYTLTATDGINTVMQTFTVAVIPDYPTIAKGATISVNFHANDVSSLSDHQVTAGEAAGFIPVDGAFWTNINLGAPGGHNTPELIFAPTQLTDDAGNANAATIATTTSSYFVGYAANAASQQEELGLSGNDDDLFNSYLGLNGPGGDGSPSDAATLTISGLGSTYTSGGYTLIIYGDSDIRAESITNRTSNYAVTSDSGFIATVFNEDFNAAPGGSTFDGVYVFSDFDTTDGDDYSNFTIIEGMTASSFTIDITSPDGGRGAISGFQIVANPNAMPLQLHVVSDGTDLDFSWNSLAGMSYNLRSSTTLTTDPLTWPIVPGQGDIPNTAPTNNLTITRPADGQTFYVVEEFPTP